MIRAVIMARTFRAYTEIGKKIAALGKRQKNIARSLGVSQQTVSKKLRGECAIMLSDLEMLSKAYGVSLTYFFEEGPGDPELAAVRERLRCERGPLRDLVVFADKLRPSDQEKLLAIARTLVS
jgi:transcriptional regulator with XRE-family HTH domain